MSKKVVYEGTSDFQEFSAADFKKAGVEGQGKVTFAQGEPTEVSDEAAEALVSTDHEVFGDYAFSAAPEEDSTENEDLNKDVNEEVTTEGTANPPAAGNVGRGSTGRGTSTRGSAT